MFKMTTLTNLTTSDGCEPIPNKTLDVKYIAWHVIGSNISTNPMSIEVYWAFVMDRKLSNAQ